MTPQPSNASHDAGDHRLSALSALADGDSSAVDDACASWRDDPDARRTWHAYHLIGDVLRSDDLARPSSGDAAFLNAFRARMATEPVVLAPVAPQIRLRRSRWAVPMAAAAGVFAVAGVMVVSRMQSETPGAGPTIAVGPLPLQGATRAAVRDPSMDPLKIDGRLIRDAQLDRYLRAHREIRGGAAAAVPGGAMRSVDTLAPAR